MLNLSTATIEKAYLIKTPDPLTFLKEKIVKNGRLQEIKRGVVTDENFLAGIKENTCCWLFVYFNQFFLFASPNGRDMGSGLFVDLIAVSNNIKTLKATFWIKEKGVQTHRASRSIALDYFQLAEILSVSGLSSFSAFELRFFRLAGAILFYMV